MFFPNPGFMLSHSFMLHLKRKIPWNHWWKTVNKILPYLVCFESTITSALTTGIFAEHWNIGLLYSFPNPGFLFVLNIIHDYRRFDYCDHRNLQSIPWKILTAHPLPGIYETCVNHTLAKRTGAIYSCTKCNTTHHHSPRRHSPIPFRPPDPSRVPIQPRPVSPSPNRPQKYYKHFYVVFMYFLFQALQQQLQT